MVYHGTCFLRARAVITIMAIGWGRLMGTRLLGYSLGVIAACLPVVASPALALADPVAELDALSRASTAAATGLALARKQAGGGDLLGAVATLERVLISHPESD